MKSICIALLGVVSAEMFPAEVNKYGGFALGVGTGAIVEYAAYYDDNPCINDVALITQDLTMMWYIYQQFLDDDAYPYVETMAPYMINMMVRGNNSKCGKADENAEKFPFKGTRGS